jgi:26S proteasome regulatory subunit N3
VAQVAKAIRDGAVDATLDYTTKCMLSKEVVDVYSSTEPQAAFHSRVSFCLDTYNEAVRAMRYPPGAHKKGLERCGLP